MTTGIMELIDRISALEKQIKKEHPKQKGMVLIANAKTNASYEIDKKDNFRWNVAYYEQLQKLV